MKQKKSKKRQNQLTEPLKIFLLPKTYFCQKGEWQKYNKMYHQQAPLTFHQMRNHTTTIIFNK